GQSQCNINSLTLPGTKNRSGQEYARALRRKLANAIARRTLNLTQAHQYAQLLRELEGGPAAMPRSQPTPAPLTKREARDRAYALLKRDDDNPGRDQTAALAALPHSFSRGKQPDVQNDLRVGRLSMPALKRAPARLQGQKDELT